ncbi:hypothetical protein [Kineococcus sp. SYSU DK005]|uniref:hypothetical protein n=1 Tax=Kineococcus sp. SYSU DK005 TaxID=3383126 RepID=UPI003D7CD2DD
MTPYRLALTLAGTAAAAAGLALLPGAGTDLAPAPTGPAPAAAPAAGPAAAVAEVPVPAVLGAVHRGPGAVVTAPLHRDDALPGVLGPGEVTAPLLRPGAPGAPPRTSFRPA